MQLPGQGLLKGKGKGCGVQLACSHAACHQSDDVRGGTACSNKSGGGGAGKQIFSQV